MGGHRVSDTGHLEKNLAAIRRDKSPVCRCCRYWLPEERTGKMQCTEGHWRAGHRTICTAWEREPGADDYL